MGTGKQVWQGSQQQITQCVKNRATTTKKKNKQMKEIGDH